MTKKTVLISCVTFETVMISAPAVEYKADEIHLFHYVRPDVDRKSVYTEFYEETVRQISEKLPAARIVEHRDTPVYDFRLMLRDILACIDEIESTYEDAEIFINVSAGTSEFIAAGVISTMMSKGRASAFTVRTSEYTVVGEDKIRSMYYSQGRPVGLSASVKSPSQLPFFEIARPDENLVRGLRLYVDLRDARKSVTSAVVIDELKKAGLWMYSPFGNSDKTDIRQKETMYYQRHFVNTWDDLGWIERPGRKARVTITPLGMNVIRTFYVD